MYTYDFEFGTSPITITTKKILTEDLQLQILKMMQYVKYDFNQNIHNSSAYRLNDVDPSTPCPVDKEFVYYLKLNIRKTDDSSYKFNPFKCEGYEINNINKVFEFDGDIIVKTEPVLFESNDLMEPFVIDTLFDILKENGFNNFFVESQNCFIAHGLEDRKIEFDIENEFEFSDTIFNKVVSFHFNHEYDKEKDFKQSFASINTEVKFKYSIIYSTSAIENKVISEELRSLVSSDDFKFFAKNNKIKIVLITVDDKELIFE